MKITVIPGDGIGPEVIESAKRCVNSLLDVEWIEVELGINAQKKYGKVLPDEVIKAITKTKIALKGPVTTPIGEGFHSVNVRLRKELDLYANVRPCNNFDGVKSVFNNIDLVIIRENTEDLYSGIEFYKGNPSTIKLIEFLKKGNINVSSDSVKASERIVKYAFEYATKRNRKKVTAVHKANIMKFTDGLFLNIARKIAKKYPNIEFEDVIVDNMAMQLVKNPNNYDIIVTSNLYGDILSDLCAGLVGGLGLVAGANIGDKYAVFETVHGSAPKYAGKNKVNPTAAILAAILMLRHMGKKREADIIKIATENIIKERKNVTYDIARGKAVGTKEMTDAIIKEINKRSL